MVGAVLALIGTVFSGVSNNILASKKMDADQFNAAALREVNASQLEMIKYQFISQQEQQQDIIIIAIVLLILAAFAYLIFRP